MKIAFLNPWRNAAENQAFESLKIAAARVGHELVHCSNSDELEDAKPEFALAASSIQPKLTRFPTYGVIHEPRDRFLASKEYFRNLLTYDGYLTISDTLATFLKHLLFGVGRDATVGYYYNTCQKGTADPNFRTRLERGDVKITYFGTNWDNRRSSFFRELSEWDQVEIYGPAKSWQGIRQKSYRGFIPFDGHSVQDKYRANGIGLVMLSTRHVRDDVISNRIFEIASVGAIAVCCRIPWLERNFNDSVYYFEQQCSDARLIEQVRTIVDRIKSDPQDAFERARRAQQMFEEKFCAEVLLENAVRYHEERRQEKKLSTQAHRSSTTQSEVPYVSAIVRCGGRPVQILRRALSSLAEQTLGRFDVILVRYKPLHLDEVIAEFSSTFASIRCVDCFGGNRSASLWRGLNEVRGDYFAILDDDDELLPNHFESLFSSQEWQGKKDYFTYSGYISAYLQPRKWAHGNAEENLERRFIHDRAFGIGECYSFFDQSGYFAPNGFVASSALLDSRLLMDPQMDTAEDSYLILSLIAKSYPKFTFRATAVHHESEEASNFAEHPNRAVDIVNYRLRCLSYADRRPVLDALDILQQWYTNFSKAQKLHDSLLFDGLDCLPMMSIGEAGVRGSTPDEANRGAVWVKPGAKGVVAFGPYIRLSAGRYEVTFVLDPQPGASLSVDVAIDSGNRVLAQQHLRSHRRDVLYRTPQRQPETLVCVLSFEISEGATRHEGTPVEFRVWSAGKGGFSLVSLRLRQIDEAVPKADHAAR